MSGYPVVKDSLQQAHSLIQSNGYSNALYTRATALSLSVLSKLEPLQKRLPLETVDGYANAGLDYVEKRFPQVKSETGELLKTARKPADDAAGLAKAYADGITSVSRSSLSLIVVLALCAALGIRELGRDRGERAWWRGRCETVTRRPTGPSRRSFWLGRGILIACVASNLSLHLALSV